MRAKTVCSACFLLGLILAPSAGSVPPSVDQPFLLTRLGLDLQIDYDANTVGGTATLEVRNTSDKPQPSVPLLLNRLMTVSQATDSAGTELPFQQAVVIFQDDPALQVNSIVVKPKAPLPPGATFTVALHYRGVLVGYTETGSLYIQDHVNHDFTIIREDAYAFPVLGVPSRAANRAAPREPFAFSARITVPPGLVVAMGGVPGDPTPHNGLVTWNYQSTEPVPFLNITVAPYEQLDRPGAHIFYFPADAAGAKALDQAIGNAMRRYASWFGPLVREPHLVVMEIPERFGSQASLTAGILQTADAFRDRSELAQVYHELSHLWNVPDLDRPSPRWNEGLASFLQSRMAADLDGWNQWDARLARNAAQLRQYCAAPAPCNTAPMADYGKAGLTDYSYSVGLFLFYALDQVMGREAFDRAYAGFYQQHREKGATTADLVSAFRVASPKSDKILQDWLLTNRWYALLSSGKPIQQILDDYKQP